MTRRNDDTNGDGIAARRLLHKPLVIPLALVIMLGGPVLALAYGYGGLNTGVITLDDRVSRLEERVEKRLDRITDQLDELLRFVLPSRWDQ